MKTGLQDRLTAPERDRVAPDTGPMTGSISNQQPSTIRGEAHRHYEPAEGVQTNATHGVPRPSDQRDNERPSGALASPQARRLRRLRT
jgi:hypothetical protein